MNKGELSETYAFLYLLHFNKVNFADAELNQLKDYIKVLSLAENNYESSIKINLDKTISIVKSVMEKAGGPTVKMTVPLTVEAGVGQSWAEAH